MSDRPVILRARIALALASRHPAGMTCNQVSFALGVNLPAGRMAEVLEAMASDGLLDRGRQARPGGHAPLATFAASAALAGLRGVGRAPRAKGGAA